MSVTWAADSNVSTSASGGALETPATTGTNNAGTLQANVEAGTGNDSKKASFHGLPLLMLTDDDDDETPQLQFGEYGYLPGAPSRSKSVRYSVAQVFNSPSGELAQPFELPQLGAFPALEGDLPQHFELERALTEAELQKAEMEKQLLLEELARLRKRMIGILTVGVLEAHGLLGTFLGERSRSPYAIITVEKQKEKTKKVKNTLNPKWDSGFKFYVSNPSTILSIVVYDWDRFLPDTFLGKIEIPIAELVDGQQIERWYTLLPKRAGAKVSGEINLKILYQKEKWKRSTFWVFLKIVSIISRKSMN